MPTLRAPSDTLRWFLPAGLGGLLVVASCSGTDESSTSAGGGPGAGGEAAGSGGSMQSGGASSKSTGGSTSKSTGGASSKGSGGATNGGATNGGSAGSPSSTGGAAEQGGASSGAAGEGNAGGEDAGGGPSGGTPSGGTSSGGAGGEPGSGGDMGSGGVGDICGCMPFEVAWGRDGGFVAYREASELVPCRVFRHQRDPLVTDPPSLQCEQEVVACGDAIGSSDVLLALQNPDVQAAIDAAPVLYGQDTRPVDGQVLQVRIDGALIEIGTDCGGGLQGCSAIPDGVAVLGEVLLLLTEGELGRGECAETFP